MFEIVFATPSADIIDGKLVKHLHCSGAVSRHFEVELLNVLRA